jgi:hypothetical protein
LKVKSCEPCRFDAGAGSSFEVHFKPAGEKGVTAIEVAALRGGKAATPQVFQLEDAWSPSDDFFLQGIDINFDGVLDLAFGALLGTPNLTLDYWTVDAQRVALDRIGKFTNLSVDPQTHELKTYEKGGHAGLLNESKTYRWQDGKLTAVRATSQTQASDGKGYVKTTQRLDKGSVVEEKREPVKAP